ncbi:MAG: PKD domain-containing protein [Thermoplasmata archaeon]|nr:PKD domain-containing protein [Thermoplasmata archaeon]
MSVVVLLVALVGLPNIDASPMGPLKFAPTTRDNSASPDLTAGGGAAAASATGSGPILDSTWPLLLNISSSASSVCAFGSSRCDRASSVVRISLTATDPLPVATGSASAQVLFLLDESPMMVCNAGVGCPAGGSNAFQTFLGSASVIAHAIQHSHPSVAVSFALAVTDSAGEGYDDGDSTPFAVPVGNFTNASMFGVAVSHHLNFPGDSDRSDNSLQSDVITALFGAMSDGAANSSPYASMPSGPVNWTPGEDHAIVWLGSTAPVDANYSEAPCAFVPLCLAHGSNASMPTCASPSGIHPSLPACEGWISSQTGNALDSIAALSRTSADCVNSSLGHCTIDSVVVNASSTDPTGPAWLVRNTSGQNATDVRTDVAHIVGAGCDMARFTGGSWDGPKGSRCGNLSGTLGSAGSFTYPALVSALENVSLGTSGNGTVAEPFANRSMFRFVTAPQFSIALSLHAVATCSSRFGPLPSCPQEPSLVPGHGSAILAWNWSSFPGNSSMHAGDTWHASFDLVASGAPSPSAPIDSCSTSECATVENRSSAMFTTGVQFRSPPLPGGLAESFPLLAIAIVATPGLTGAVVPAIFTSEARTPVSMEVAIAGGYAPFEVSWAFGDGTYENDSASMFANHTYATAGFVHVLARVVDKTRSTVNVSSTVTVLPLLEASAGPTGIVGYVPLPINFTATPTGGLAPYNVTWQFGDGTVGNGSSLLHVFVVPGLYTIVAIESDALGHSSAVNLSVDVGGALSGPALTGQATVRATASTGCPTREVHYTFVGTASGGQPPYDFSWMFGDGTGGSGATVVHSYSRGVAAPTSLHSTLTVTDSVGATFTTPATLPGVSAAPPCPATGAAAPSLPLLVIVLAGGAAAAIAAAVVGFVIRRQGRR